MYSICYSIPVDDEVLGVGYRRISKLHETSDKSGIKRIKIKHPEPMKDENENAFLKRTHEERHVDKRGPAKKRGMKMLFAHMLL